ncbi:MAG: XkdF-like putative serine protease domain-containing protein [Synergistaceae bacterium]|nr:XkdF-like putative serine protease domain-containing protein [Synergistaceae bacterium]
MANLLKNMRINFISLVPQGANGEQVLWKSKEAAPIGSVAITRTIALAEIAKSEEKRMVYGIVYPVNKVDSQGDYSTAAEIEKAAYDFMKDLRVQNVDTGHSFEKAGAFVAESWLAKSGDSLFPEAPEGSWAVGIKVEDDALWERVKKGEFKGLSMAGFGTRVPDSSKEDGIHGFMKSISELIEKALNKKSPEQEGVDPKMEELLKQLNQKLDEGLTIKKEVEALRGKVETLEKTCAGLKANPSDNHNTKSADEVGGIL